MHCQKAVLWGAASWGTVSGMLLRRGMLAHGGSSTQGLSFTLALRPISICEPFKPGAF